MWRAKVLSIFPEMFPGTLGYSLAGKALKAGIWSLDVVNIRDFAEDKHATVDGSPCGGGSGMIMRADVVGRALDSVRNKGDAVPVLLTSPKGAKLCQSRLKEWAAAPEIIILCGRYEGIDDRIAQLPHVEEVSIGDFVLSGGELAAQIIIDGVVRLLPEVMGNQDSLKEESFTASDATLLEYPQYTLPKIWNGMEVPEILFSGNHAKIAEWRLNQSIELTKKKRPDLWQRYIDFFKNKY